MLDDQFAADITSGKNEDGGDEDKDDEGENVNPMQTEQNEEGDAE